MARAIGKDLCEIFGYAPDDTSEAARRQWKAQRCPFVGNTCIKHSHPASGQVVVYGTCSVVNKPAGSPGRRMEQAEVIICPQRFYANDYEVLRTVAHDTVGSHAPLMSADEYSRSKKNGTLPHDVVVRLGKGSGKEIQLTRRDQVTLSLDWVLARVTHGELTLIVPCEVQSMDITGNYRAAWEAYRDEAQEVPDSKHGMNWANVWKRMIPQLILKGSVAATSGLCTAGNYFILPDRAYMQFERLLGDVETQASPGVGVLTVMTYGLGPKVPPGSIRSLRLVRTLRMLTTDLARSFSVAGKQLALGSVLDEKVASILGSL